MGQEAWAASRYSSHHTESTKRVREAILDILALAKQSADWRIPDEVTWTSGSSHA